MTRSRAKRQQAKQVKILIEMCHENVSAHWDQYDDDACTRMMVMDIYDAALGEAGRQARPSWTKSSQLPRNCCSHCSLSTAQQFRLETALPLKTHTVTHSISTQHTK